MRLCGWNKTYFRLKYDVQADMDRANFLGDNLQQQPCDVPTYFWVCSSGRDFMLMGKEARRKLQLRIAQCIAWI